MVIMLVYKTLSIAKHRIKISLSIGRLPSNIYVKFVKYFNYEYVDVELERM